MMYEQIPGTTVIGFVGHAGHGKDEAARIIAKHVTGVRRYTFSDAIAIYARLRHGMTVRDPEVLQRVGYMMRETQPAAWIESVYWQIRDHNPEIALVTGVRFDDEATMIRSLGGALIRVERYNEDGSEFVATDRPRDHPVERDIPHVHCEGFVRNTSGLRLQFGLDVIDEYRKVLDQAHACAKR